MPKSWHFCKDCHTEATPKLQIKGSTNVPILPPQKCEPARGDVLCALCLCPGVWCSGPVPGSCRVPQTKRPCGWAGFCVHWGDCLFCPPATCCCQICLSLCSGCSQFSKSFSVQLLCLLCGPSKPVLAGPQQLCIPLVLVLPHHVPAAAPGNGQELVAPTSFCLYSLHLLSILLGFLLYYHFPSFTFYLNKNATFLDYISCIYKLDFSQARLADIHLTSLSSLDLASELVSSTNAMNLPLPPLATS